MSTQVAQLYVALFGRAPDAGGLDYWTTQLNAGSSMEQVADTMFGTAPARAYFPSGLTNEQIVGAFYANVLGRPADASGLAFWSAKLNAAGATPGTVISEMIGVIASYTGSDPAGIASAALFNNRAAAAQFYGEHSGSIANATTVLDTVTADIATVLLARALVLEPGVTGTQDVGGFTELTTGPTGDGLTLANVAQGAAWTITASPGTTSYPPVLVFSRTDTSSLQDQVSVTLKSAGAITLDGLKLPGVEHLAFISVDTDSAVHENVVWMGDFTELQSITVSGNADFRLQALMNTSLRLFDAHAATGTIDYMATCIGGPSVVIGGQGNDRLSAIGYEGDSIDAGAGDDYVACGSRGCMMTGGAGSDLFAWQPNANGETCATITDFTKTSGSARGDGISFYGAASYANNPVFNSTRLDVSGAASFRDCLDAATQADFSATGRASIRWFQYVGDTYIAVDNSNAPTFQDRFDSVIRLAGLIDLGTGVTLSDFFLIT